MERLLLTLMLVVMSSSVMAEWVEIGKSKDFTVYVDPVSISRSGDTVKIWSLHDYESAQESVPYMSSTLEREHDCKEKQARQLFLVFYSKNMGRGGTIWKDTEAHDWLPVTSGTIKESVWKYACRNN